MKVSKRTNRICLGLAIAALVAIFCYQVAYGTNESDYKWGFKAGKEMYQQCSRYNICTIEENLLGPCELPYHGPHWYKNGSIRVHIGPLHSIDNVTACNDGYFHGWIHECKNDGGGPICKYQDGGLVIAAITGPGHCYNTTKEGETCESDPMIPIH